MKPLKTNLELKKQKNFFKKKKNNNCIHFTSKHLVWDPARVYTYTKKNFFKLFQINFTGEKTKNFLKFYPWQVVPGLKTLIIFSNW